MVALIALSLPAFADAAAPSSSSASVAGYWHVEGRLAGNAIRLLCHFDHAGVDFGGLCFGDGTSAIGNFDKGRAVWRWKAGGHMLTFDGMLADGALKGKVMTVAFAGIPVTGNFTAARPETLAAAAGPPQGAAALKLILGDLAHGELPAESCTAEFADGLRKQMPALQSAYEKLGAIKSISFIDSLRGSAKLTTEVYEVHFAAEKRLCSIDVTNAGKLSDLICVSE